MKYPARNRSQAILIARSTRPNEQGMIAAQRRKPLKASKYQPVRTSNCFTGGLAAKN
jgi:hypothetical protein